MNNKRINQFRNGLANRRMLGKLVTTLALAGWITVSTTSATASIINNPASIVDHGTYITDTANGLDYLKFSFTLGMSFNDAIATYASAGWQAATGAQVQSLEGQFGWVSDTPSIWGAGANANAGLTDAVAGYLGYTFYNTTATTCCGNRGILATTADVRSPGTNWDSFLMIDVITNNLNDQVEIHYTNGIYGTGDAGITSISMPNQATWMVQTTTVPVPAALWLFGSGLIGIFGVAKRKNRI